MVYVSHLSPTKVDSAFVLANLPRFAKRLKPLLEARPDLLERLGDASNDRYAAQEKLKPFIEAKAIVLDNGSYCDDIGTSLELAENMLVFAAETTRGILQELGAKKKVIKYWHKRFTKQKKSLQYQVAKIEELHKVSK